MKKKAKDNIFIRIFGIEKKGDVLVATIVFVAFITFYIFNSMYTKYKLDNQKTEIVSAEIIDVGIRTRGGLGVKPKIGYIKFRYFIKGKEIIHYSESFNIRDNIEQYQIGDCIELLISLEDERIYQWNKSKGTFKCK